MSHEIETAMFVGRPAWHGLGQLLQNPPTVEEGIRQAGLDWTVDLRPLHMDGGRTVPAFATVRATDNSILGVVGPQYRPLQNVEAFKWFQPLLDEKEAELHTAGSLQNGRKVWVLAKICRDGMEIAEGDVVKKYILLSNSHDGTRAIRVGFTPIRVVCANTLSLAHRDDASQLIRVLHRKGAVDTLGQLREAMNTANESFEATAEQYRKLARCKLNVADFRKYVREVFQVEEAAEVSTRQENIFGAVERLWTCGKGNSLPSVRNTAWTAYNALNEFLAYERGRSADSRLDSLWFGEAATIDRRALELALTMAV